MTDNFITQKPANHFLSTLVDYYFYIDILVDELNFDQEYIIPFPRITFGYFFDHPFLVTNHTRNESVAVDMAISRISTDKITVQPQSDRIKILGAHVRPYTLAHLTNKPIDNLPWLINTVELFQEKATSFKSKIDRCHHPEQMFREVEKIFLETLLSRKLKVVIAAVDMIEERCGDVKFAEVAEQVGVSQRTLRNQFYKFIGCSPKDYMHLVKLKQSVHQMKFSDQSLTDITYGNNYFDQAHFINTVKRITGRSPKNLRDDIPDFRFLQF